MRYIEIQDGISINVEKIEGIEDIDGMTCKVYICGKTYISTYPYNTLLQLIKQDDLVNKSSSKEVQIEKTMKKLDGVIGTFGNFAG